MIKTEASQVVIVKGFYFTKTAIVSQPLYSTLTEEPKYNNYISGLTIEAISNQLIPNSNQVVYDALTNTNISDISYTTPMNITLNLSSLDKLNPEDSDIRGYELKIVYNTVESDTNFVHDNDIRLPYFTNILDVQSEDIQFIKE